MRASLVQPLLVVFNLGLVLGAYHAHLACRTGVFSVSRIFFVGFNVGGVFGILVGTLVTLIVLRSREPQNLHRQSAALLKTTTALMERMARQRIEPTVRAKTPEPDEKEGTA